MLGGTGSPGGASPGGDELLTVTVVRDALGYGMKVSGDNPVYVQSVKEHGAAWRAGLRSGDRILRVDSVPVHHHTHQQVVQMIRANPSTVLTVQQHASRHKTPITAPVPVNSEKLRQLEVSKAQTVRLMLEQEQKYIRDLRNELSKVPDVRKQAQLESADARCAKLQHEIDTIMASQPASGRKPASPPPQHTGFLSGLPRSLSNLTGQSLRNLRQARQSKPQETPPPLVRQNSDEAGAKRRHGHNNTVPLVPTTCLDNVSPPPLPPRYRTNPPNPIQTKPKPGSSVSPVYKGRYPMHQSMPAYERDGNRMHRSSHSLDGELDGPKPNSIAMQMSYPLVNAPPPPLQTDNRGNVPVLHVRSQSSPEHLEYDVNRSSAGAMSPLAAEKDPSWRGTPPPGTPPPPYAHNTQPCADPQRAIISMEEDDSPASDNSSHSGLFSNMRAVRESKARMAVLLNWLLAERRCAYAGLLLVLTDGYRAAAAGAPTLRRWAYEIQSTFLMPNAVLQLNGVDENMANEIEHVLVNEYDKEEILRTVFRKARAAALEQLQAQLAEFQGKRRLGLATLYGPDDALLDKCDQDKQQEQIVVERVLCARLSSLTSASPGPGVSGVGGVAGDAHQALVAAVVAAALALQCRPASVAAAAGGARASFLQRDKLYKQRMKQLAKNHPQPFVVRGHHLQLQALTSVGHCHHCDLVIWGLAPQAYVCTDCKLRVHRQCARNVEEGCCLGRCDEAPKRGSRLIDRIHPPTANGQTNAQDSNDKKSRKASGTSHFINMERSVRKIEDEPWDQTLTPAAAQERRDESDESLYESADCHSDAISASDDALPRLGKTPTMSKESLKLAITDEEVELRPKKSHRKTMSLSNPLEIVKNFGDEWFDGTKKDTEKHSDKKKSRESLWSEEDKDSLHGSTMKLDQIKENSKKGDSSQSNSRKSSTVDPPKSRKTSKTSSVSALNFLRRKKTPTSSMKTVEAVAEAVDKMISTDELLNSTKLFLESEKRHSAVRDEKPVVETDSDEEMPVPKPTEQRRRLSRQTSRSKSKARGKSQSVKVNTLRKSHSGTLKKGKKKSSKMGTPLAARSRQASVVEHTAHIKKNGDSFRQSSWLFSGSRGEPRREGSTDETAAAEVDGDADSIAKETPDKDHAWRSPSGGVRGVNRAESCRERDAPRRGKHRNASDPNRRANVDHRDLEPGAAHVPSGSSSSSSLSSRSNESNTAAAPADHQASQSDWSEEDEPLAAQWADSLPTHVLDSLLLSPRLRKRQEVIHELIVSEGSHVRWLKVLGGVFLRPLETQGALLPPEELRALFPNLPAVRERHQRLYMDLRALRTDANNHVVPVRPLAEAMLNTLGEVNYATHLSRFCRGQRMALEALRERRRKSKELHQFLAAREQLPLCGRLQLKDLLACVWQRLTKYQLLLESILKTMSETDNDCSGECDSEDDIARLRKALDTAKDVLQGVDMAIRTAENEHRLRNIQNKLEIRIAATGGEWDEARRLDLPSHTLRMEGDLAVRNDNNKKSNVLALMLSDCLVLLQREGERFALKPLAAGAGRDPLAPLVRWDKVLFRPNAACRNTFFLMNINGVQMHELSTSTNNEYATWVKHIQELPLAKPELKQAIPTPLHQPSRSIDEPSSTVSRKPSDASEKSNSIPGEDNESERDRQSLDRTSTERERDDKRSVEREERRSMDKEEAADREEKHKTRRPTVGRISTHCSSPPPPLLPPAAVRVAPPAAAMAQTARTAITHQEHLRRLDESISSALSAKCAVVAAALGLPAGGYAHLADLAVADTLGLVDVPTELRQTGGLSRTGSVEEEPTASPAANAPPPDMHQLLLAAQAQVNQLSECLSGALTASAATVVGATARGRCDQCRPHRHRPNSDITDASSPKTEDLSTPEGELATPVEPDALEALECDLSAAQLARRLVGLSSGLQGTVSALLCALPALAAERRALRSELCASRQRAARLQSALQSATQGQAPPPYESFALTDEISYPKEGGDQTIQDQPSNGG